MTRTANPGDAAVRPLAPVTASPATPSPTLPAYVAKVLEELTSVEFETGRLCRRPLPDPFAPIVICVVKNERDRIPDFLRHYRAAGIERFVFIDNQSDDGTFELLQRQPDLDLYRRPGAFDWMRKQGWINKVIEIYGHERWYIYVDADEHIVFDGIEQRSFIDLTRRMARRGVRRVRGFLLDMYAEGAVLESRYTPAERLAAAYPFFDREGYREERYQEVISFKGGPRMRAFAAADPKFLPELTKYPLFWTMPGEYMVNPHHIWPYNDNFESDRYLAILHYKFLPGIMDKVREAIKRANYWDGSLEYRCYAKILEADPTLSLVGPVSTRFTNSAELIALRLITPLQWSSERATAVAMALAYRERRAALLGGASAALGPAPASARLSAATRHASGSPNGHGDGLAGPLSRPSAIAADPRLAEELAAALGEHAALITHVMDRWFDHALSQIERISSRLDGAALAAPGHVDVARVSPGATVESPSAAPHSLTTDPPPPPQPLQGTAVAQFRTAEGWAGWSYHQAATLRLGGTVEIRQNRSTPGIVCDPIPVAEGGLFRLVIEAEFAVEEDGCRLHARLVGDGDASLGPDVPLGDGTSEIFLFAPVRTRELKLYLIVWQPKIGYAFAIRAVTIEKIDIEAYYECRVQGRTRPAIASLATIPSRREMLGDCVASLLLQCDKVRVFLNGYAEVPPVLAHPRIEIRRSQDWDDKGDAGKFGWLDCDEEQGYRIIADDDLIFPVDFVEKMTAAVARHNDRAIAGVHGIILKQPVTEYYDPESRSAFYFQSPLARERTVHVLGTGALCYHSSAVQMRWSDFMFRNMADVFLARYARQRAMPMVVVERPYHWVRQNTQEGGFESIYEHSLTGVGSHFNSALVQDAVIKWMQPWTLQPSSRPKIVLAIIAANVADFVLAFESWYRTRWLDFDWVVMVTAGVDDDGLRAHLTNWKTDHEMHVIDAPGTTAFERVERLLQLAGRIGFQAAVLVTGRAEFTKGAWTKPAIRLLTTPGERAVFVGSADSSGAVAGFEISPEGPVPKFAMFNASLVGSVGGLDPACGTLATALFDWMARAGRASRKPADAGRALATIADSLQIDAAPAQGEVEAGMRRALLAKAQVSPEAARRTDPARCPSLTINEVFERVLTINLDRRPDRWAQASRRLGHLGIRSERFRAVDGTAPDIIAEYEAYRRRPLVAPPQGVRPIGSSQEYYLDYDSQTARVAHTESSTGVKAIQSPGAWGYLKSWEAILEQALRDRPESLLVFDDDVILHRRTHQIFAAAVGALPADWLILQLGTLQYHWESDWVTWRGPFLYSTNGSAIGSHAVGLRFEIVPFLLDHIKRMELPFDTGSLAAATHAFKDRCFVAYPHIAIQHLADTDISTSEFQKTRTQADIAGTYRWNLADYAVDGGFRLIDKTMNGEAQVAKFVLNG